MQPAKESRALGIEPQALETESHARMLLQQTDRGKAGKLSSKASKLSSKVHALRTDSLASSAVVEFRFLGSENFPDSQPGAMGIHTHTHTHT